MLHTRAQRAWVERLACRSTLYRLFVGVAVGSLLGFELAELTLHGTFGGILGAFVGATLALCATNNDNWSRVALALVCACGGVLNIGYFPIRALVFSVLGGIILALILERCPRVVRGAVLGLILGASFLNMPFTETTRGFMSWFMGWPNPQRAFLIVCTVFGAVHGFALSRFDARQPNTARTPESDIHGESPRTVNDV